MSFPGLHELHLRNEARRATVATLAATGRPWLFTGPRGTILVSPDPSKPGRWRASGFDASGEPTGHVEAPDLAGAIEAAWYAGADVDTAREP